MNIWQQEKCLMNKTMITEIKLNNLGTVNKNQVIIKTDKMEFNLYFSYQTLVGIWYGYTRFVRQNDWSTTTGKLLNELEPNHKNRVSKEVFEAEVDKMMMMING